jgi:hypothetical protein
MTVREALADAVNNCGDCEYYRNNEPNIPCPTCARWRAALAQPEQSDIWREKYRNLRISLISHYSLEERKDKIAAIDAELSLPDEASLRSELDGLRAAAEEEAFAGDEARKELAAVKAERDSLNQAATKRALHIEELVKELAVAQQQIATLQQRSDWLDRMLLVVDMFLHCVWIDRPLPQVWAESLHNVVYEQGKQGPADARGRLSRAALASPPATPNEMKGR